MEPRVSRRKVAIAIDPTEKRTKEEFAKEADIRTLWKRHTQQGIPLPQRRTVAQYLDLGDAPSLQVALNRVAEANHAFSQLPAELRDRLHNDPRRFLDFVHTKKGQEELIELGLATKRETQEPPKGPPSKASQPPKAKGRKDVQAGEPPADGGGDPGDDA